MWFIWPSTARQFVTEFFANPFLGFLVFPLQWLGLLEVGRNHVPVPYQREEG
jgi:hypothetical protein